MDAAIHRALEKVPADRFAGAQEFTRALADPAFRHGTEEALALGAEGQRSAWRRVLAPAAGFGAGVAAALTLWAVVSLEDAPAELMRFTIVPPVGAPLDPAGNGHDLAISPDGSVVVYQSAAGDAGFQLHVRSLDELDPAPLRGTEGAATPFFSPDGERVGFVQAQGGRVLQQVSVLGGPPMRLAETENFILGCSWGADDRIVCGTRGAGLFQVPGGGGDPEELTQLDAERGESAHAQPHIVEGQDVVLFVASSGGGPELASGQIAVLDLGSGQVTHLGLAGVYPRYVSTGHLVYAVQDGSIRAVSFDVASLAVTGNPVPLAEGVRVKNSGAANFDISRDGRLVYSQGMAGGDERSLVWVGRDGSVQPTGADPRRYFYPRISPDGGRVALDVQGDSRELWVWDFDAGTSTRVLPGEGVQHQYPVWTPDGERLAFSDVQGPNIYWKRANNAGVAEVLAELPGGTDRALHFITPDGTGIVFSEATNLLRMVSLVNNNRGRLGVAQYFRDAQCGTLTRRPLDGVRVERVGPT